MAISDHRERLAEASQLLSEAANFAGPALRATPFQLVLAESCTAGLVAATLAQTAGASAGLCGSAVVYQEQTKSAWLGVKAETLRQYTAVSEPVAAEMAIGVLHSTPHATLAVSVTGHLGPDAPPEQDGLVFSAGATRTETGPQLVAPVQMWRLRTYEEVRDPVVQRLLRQQLAARMVLLNLGRLCRVLAAGARTENGGVAGFGASSRKPGAFDE